MSLKIRLGPLRSWASKLVVVIFFCPLCVLWTSNLLAAPPFLGTISPSSGSVVPDTIQSFTCAYTDADGWANLKKLHFLVSRNSTSLANSVYFYYNQDTNKLYLRDDANTAWLGGYAPGSPNTIKNSQVKLKCSSTIVSGSGTSLIVNWNISFKAAYSGKTYKTYLSAKDDSGGSADWTQKGTITIRAASDTTTPTVFITSPANGATVSGAITLSATASDAGGVAGVQFKLDGVALGVEDTTFPYDLLWNTTVASNSLHSLTAVARDTAGNTAVPASITVTVNNGADTPTRPVVTDDGLYTDSSTQLHAKWISSDAKSGVVEYQYSIETVSGYTDIIGWTSTTANEITVTGLTLVLDSPYYFNVKAKNGAGFWSKVGSSDGIKYNSPPEICKLTPQDKSSFIEGDVVPIYACAGDRTRGDVKEFQISIDNVIVQPWGPPNPGATCLCFWYDDASLTYNWQTKTGDSGLHKIKVEARDNKVAPVFKEVTIFIYKKPLGPPA